MAGLGVDEPGLVRFAQDIVAFLVSVHAGATSDLGLSVRQWSTPTPVHYKSQSGTLGRG